MTHQDRWLVTVTHALETPSGTIRERLHQHAHYHPTDSNTGVRGAAASEFPRQILERPHPAVRTVRHRLGGPPRQPDADARDQPHQRMMNVSASKTTSAT